MGPAAGRHAGHSARGARSFTIDETGLSLGAAGTAQIADPAARTKHEVDLLAVATGERPQSPRAATALIGQAKATVQPRGLKDLERLEHIRALLADQGHRPDDAVLALFRLKPRNGRGAPTQDGQLPLQPVRQPMSLIS
ncbi:hypothetical protein [Streptomyces sp. NPDC001292]|uniref:hypothetical protein n=1 Tax=Streptomyces sp. NPDC001292 TaxID=3364558 RepID=UPI003675A46C